MTALPWDRFSPDAPPEPEPESQLPWDRFEPDELPYEPPAPADVSPRPKPVPVPTPSEPVVWPSEPVTTPEIDLGAVAQEALTDALESVWPSIREKAVGYAKDSVKDIMAGQTVDVLNPTITAETKAGRELVVADARSRSWRTLVQGLAIDLFAAVLAVLATVSGADPLAGETWILIVALLIKTVIQTVVAYFMRLKVTPTIRAPGEKMALMPIPRPMMEEKR